MLTAPRNGSDPLLDQGQPSRPAYVKLVAQLAGLDVVHDIDVVKIDSCSAFPVHLVPTQAQVWIQTQVNRRMLASSQGQMSRGEYKQYTEYCRVHT